MRKSNGIMVRISRVSAGYCHGLRAGWNQDGILINRF